MRELVGSKEARHVLTAFFTVIGVVSALSTPLGWLALPASILAALSILIVVATLGTVIRTLSRENSDLTKKLDERATLKEGLAQFNVRIKRGIELAGIVTEGVPGLSAIPHRDRQAAKFEWVVDRIAEVDRWTAECRETVAAYVKHRSWELDMPVIPASAGASSEAIRLHHRIMVTIDRLRAMQADLAARL